jgi:hypothetical protein
LFSTLDWSKQLEAFIGFVADFSMLEAAKAWMLSDTSVYMIVLEHPQTTEFFSFLEQSLLLQKCVLDFGGYLSSITSPIVIGHGGYQYCPSCWLEKVEQASGTFGLCSTSSSIFLNK